jgi:hypothetical protein
LSCKGDDGSEQPPLQQVDVLEADLHLVRASMAIRGLRPTPDDLASVRQDRSNLEPLIDSYLDSPEFGETAKDMWAELLLVRADTRDTWPAAPLPSADNDGAVFTSMTEAPLRLIEAVVTEDRPFSDVLTEPNVYADRLLVDLYGLEGWDDAGPEVQALPWTDGRPGAGVLVDTALWQRHESNGSNFHRGRANQISRVFLCDNIGSRDIDIGDGIDLSDPAAVTDAVSTDPSCMACHTTLDPLAGYLWGFKGNMRRSGIFMAYNNFDCEGVYADWCYPVRFYAPEDAELWSDNQLPPPAFAGAEVGDLVDLGTAIGQDPRFDRCMTKEFASFVLQVEQDDLAPEDIDAWQSAFADSAQSAKALVRKIVWSDAFSAQRDQTDLFTIRPGQYARMLQDLTGFRYLATTECEDGNCWGEVDLLTSSLYGFRSMAGGIDGYQVTRPAHTATPTRHLVMARVANEAAGFVVQHDFAIADQTQRKLLTKVQATDIDEAVIRAQLAMLHDRILAEPIATNHLELTETWQLFSAALQRHNGDPAMAWTVVISAMLQDVRVMFY